MSQYGAMSGHMFETFVISEILKSFSNLGLSYRHFVSYYRGHNKIKTKANGEVVTTEEEIDLIIEEDCGGCKKNPDNSLKLKIGKVF